MNPTGAFGRPGALRGGECDFAVGYTGGLLAGILLTPHLDAFLLWSVFVGFESWRYSRRCERERRRRTEQLPEARALRRAPSTKVRPTLGCGARSAASRTGSCQ